MPFVETGIPSLMIFEPRVFEDSRGYFYESYNQKIFSDAGIKADFIQDNRARSVYGVIRGLHYQLHPHAQSKLVSVLSGAILDVAVDIRKGSPAYGKVYTLEISAENKKQLYIPAGFAHGYSVLTPMAEVMYKVDALYNKESEAGILYNDLSLNINWRIPAGKEIISEKDTKLPPFGDHTNNFTFRS
jgi:dTDP-4-dehydrorhamnose 3,5-epimerase